MKVEVKLISQNLAHARGGEVVLYKRGDSTRWQARYKLKDLKWHRTATKHVNLQYAAQVACEAYDRARFLFDEKIPLSSKRFDVVANLTVTELQKQITAKVGTLHKQGEHDAFIVRRHVTVQLGFACDVHSYIGTCKFGLMLVLVFNGLCSLPNQQRFLKHL